MRHYSPKRAKQIRQYSQRVKVWIVDKVCGVKGCRKEATECHHMKGRTGEWLLNEDYWFPMCHDHHTRATNDSRWALDNGYSILRSTDIVFCQKCWDGAFALHYCTASRTQASYYEELRKECNHQL